MHRLTARRTRSRRPGRDRGGVLFLFPVGFLVVVILGAIAVDLGNVWLQQRRLADAADAAANDAVAAGVDQRALRGDGSLELDADLVARIVDVSMAAQDLPPGTGGPTVSFGVDGDGDPVVEVRIDATVDLVFGRLVRSGGLAISATGVAELVPG
jgi:hypothetical protein